LKFFIRYSISGLKIQLRPVGYTGHISAEMPIYLKYSNCYIVNKNKKDRTLKDPVFCIQKIEEI
jgi:hypothetical protein